jgi:predicted RNA binding protein YcfA (HicA-like mRNA interferase family)
LTPRQLIAALQRAGFSIHHQTGSHVHLRAPGPPPRRLVIAFHNRELAPLTVRKVVRQAGLTEEDFRGFL